MTALSFVVQVSKNRTSCIEVSFLFAAIVYMVTARHSSPACLAFSRYFSEEPAQRSDAVRRDNSMPGTVHAFMMGVPELVSQKCEGQHFAVCIAKHRLLVVFGALPHEKRDRRHVNEEVGTVIHAQRVGTELLL